MPPVDDPTLSPVKRRPAMAEKDVEMKTEDSSPETKPKKEVKSKAQMSIKDMFAKAAKRKAEDPEGDTDSKKIKEAKVANKRCKICKQIIHRDFIKMHLGAPTGAKEELEILFDPKYGFIIESEDYQDKPNVNMSDYTVYDEEGHLVPLDSGLMENGAKLYFDGVMKNLLDAQREGAPVKRCLITEWWTSGFDGGENVIVGFSTEYADYYLKEPSARYKPFMTSIWEQSFLVKHLIEYLDRLEDEDEGEEEEEGVYEKFLEYLTEVKIPREELAELTSETVVRHAECLVSQLFSYQAASEIPTDKNLLDTALVKRICELAGVQRHQVKKSKTRVVKKLKKEVKKWCDATVTPLVRGMFEDLFADQMADEDRQRHRSKACGVCEGCQAPDCGECKNCKNMVKFGGNGKSKQKCSERKCPNMGAETGEDEQQKPISINKPAKKEEKKVKKKDIEFSWVGKGNKIGSKTYYDEVSVDGCKVVKGDDILLEPSSESEDPYVGRVVYMFEGKSANPTVHIQWYGRGSDTVLGETGDQAELFFLDACDDENLLSFCGKAEVEVRGIPNQEEWRQLGGSVPSAWHRESESSFFCSLWYDSELGRFEYPVADPVSSDPSDQKFCGKCEVNREKENRYTLQVHEKEDGVVKSVMWDRAPLKVGDCIYLTPGSAKMKAKSLKLGKESVKKEDIDEDMYPEYYRKSEYVKGNNLNTPDTFIVARIIKFKDEGSEVRVKVGLFYRPENMAVKLENEADNMSLVYWSEDTDTVKADTIEGRCYVRSAQGDKLEAWCEEGPDRWIFRKSYDSSEKTCADIPKEAKSFGEELGEEIPTFPTFKKRLVSLDIFAGCGGLSQGLHDAGVAETRWAVEIYAPAANAFQLNNKDSTVFTDDCNLLLKNVIDGEVCNEKNQQYPKRGEVELLCGGPPCQGFSGMNRFNAGEYSLFKNSLVSSYLSYAEYYRPKFFILENVKNFANFKKSMVLKCCLRALVKMGYQCTFGILQAGQHGVAQTRRRAIILAAAPGEVLPRYPEPEHVFSPQACHLSVEVDGKRFNPQPRWTKSAPKRTVTVRDTMSDLPKILNGESKDVMKYGGEAKSHFQRNIRNGGNVLYDHITKRMAPLIVKRFELIPTAPGSDWRDLPNEAVKLSDGSMSNKLLYFYTDKKNGKSSTGEKRGVCPCMDGGKCDPKDKQQNTLIPWCLPHTGNRHNNWAGLYGRVEWDGFFSTTITNPEPMGKQGRVLHPQQNRLVSVRECARSQGFPDTYRFWGTVLEKHRQIGNAVPPPMGRALGQSIAAAIQKNKQK